MLDDYMTPEGDEELRSGPPAVANEALAAAISLAREVLPGDAWAIFERGGAGEDWELRFSHALSSAFPGRISTEDFATHAALQIDDLSAGDGADSLCEAMRREGMQSMLLVPVPVRGEPRLALACGGRELSRFGNRERSRAEELGRLAAAGLAAGELEDELRTLRAHTERSEARAAFVTEASRLLSSSLEHQETLQHVARLLVPGLADWCVVHLLDDAGVPRPAVIAHADPEKVRWARSLEGRYPPQPDAPRGLYEVVRTGRPELYPDVTGDALAAIARDEERLTILRQLTPCSALIVPLRVRGRVLGAVTLISSSPERRFDEADLQLAEQLAEQAAAAIDHARLFRQAENAAEQQRALYEAAERLAAIVASSEDAIASKDLDGMVLTWNAAAERIFGYTAAEMVGRPLARLLPPDRPDEERQILDRLRRGERIDHLETVRQRKDGQLIDVSITVSPLRDRSGRIVGASNISRDITERRRFELELQARAEEIQAQREELEMQNEELIAQNEELVNANAAKNTFVAMLAHELRNPLAPIRNATYLLGPRIPDEPTAQRHRQTIERQLRHLTQLVDDLLEASRVSRGIVTLRHELLDLGQVAGTAADALGDYVRDRGHRLPVRLPGKLVPVVGDPLRLEQVIVNLLNNAAKFTDPGGLVELEVGVEEDRAVVRVRDTGIGVPAELLPRIFDLVTQGDQGLARTRGGLGIGLNVVRNLVEMHEGTVSAHSG